MQARGGTALGQPAEGPGQGADEVSLRKWKSAARSIGEMREDF